MAKDSQDRYNHEARTKWTRRKRMKLMVKEPPDLGISTPQNSVDPRYFYPRKTSLTLQPAHAIPLFSNRTKMMKRIKTVLALLVVTSITCIGLRGYAQPNIPKEKIPSHIPADVREQIERLYSPDPIERASASFWLRKKGARAVPAIPFLIAILGDNTVVEPHSLGITYGGAPISPGEEAAQTLITMGKATVGPLMTALKDEHLGVRRMTAWLLGKINDPRAVEPLIAALKDESRVVRMMAARALGEIGEPAVEPLISALKDRNSPARGDAAWALGKIKDPRAVEPLIAALKDKNPSIQEDAEKALRKITGKDFGPDPVKWQSWWKQKKGNVGSGR